jgi:sugar-specific transcriptional regulator TrmB
LALSSEKSPVFIKTHDAKADTYRFVRRGKGLNKHLNMLENALARYGLSQNEIQTYVYLSIAGEKKAADIAEAISLHRTETYRILRELEKRGIILSIIEKPAKFVAVPPDKAVEQLLEALKIEVRVLEKEKTDLVALWSSMPKPKIEKSKRDVMQVLEGQSQIVLKADELLEKAKMEAEIFVPDRYLALLYRSDFVDSLKRRSYNLNVNLLTEGSLKSRLFCERTGWANHRECVGNMEKLPCFMVSDADELLTIYRKRVEDEGEGRRKSKIVALWTNCDALVESMRILFSELSGSKNDRQ